jgi:hypothetical protein
LKRFNKIKKKRKHLQNEASRPKIGNYLKKGSRVKPCLDTITQNGPNAGLVKQQFIVQTQLRLPIEKRVKNLKGSLSLLYRLGRVEGKCQSLVESHPQVFNLRSPCYLLIVKNYPKALEP